MTGIYGSHPEDRYFESMLNKHLEEPDCQPEMLEFTDWYGANYEGWATVEPEVKACIDLCQEALSGNKDAIRNLIVAAVRMKQKYEAGREI